MENCPTLVYTHSFMSLDVFRGFGRPCLAGLKMGSNGLSWVTVGDTEISLLYRLPMVAFF